MVYYFQIVARSFLFLVELGIKLGDLGTISKWFTTELHL